MMLTWLSGWFYSPDVSQQYRSIHYVVLFLLVLAGAMIRFWSLGDVGLHGDEETMALPAMSILENGAPLLPSGMYYPRALAQIYLMAGSVWVFGESEWALRFPSALIGSLAGFVAFFMGKRFLSPAFNLAFVAVMTFLPTMIYVSQTARMYIFWITGLMLFATLVNRWERSPRLSNLIWAFLAWAVALHFHRLAIFAAPIFLFPGVIRQSVRELVRGVIALVMAFLAFNKYNQWIEGNYPQPEERFPGSEEIARAPIELLWAGSQTAVLVTFGAVLILGVLILFYKRRVSESWAVPSCFLLAGTAFCALLQYHVGVTLLLCGAITWLRVPDKHNVRLMMILGVVVVLASIQLFMLNGSGEYAGRKVIGAMLGSPSIWPALIFSGYSYVGSVLYVLTLIFGLSQLARSRPIPDHFLFFIIGVWAPLIAIGMFKWYVPLRYTLGVLPFFILCSMAGIFYVLSNMPRFSLVLRERRYTTLALVITVLVFANPVAVVQTANLDYEDHPDHKGAAEFIKAIPLNENDVLIAEDIIQQTYYLGTVDYYLRDLDDARRFFDIRR